VTPALGRRVTTADDVPILAMMNLQLIEDERTSGTATPCT
jgi:hypothetical protein